MSVERSSLLNPWRVRRVYRVHRGLVERWLLPGPYFSRMTAWMLLLGVVVSIMVTLVNGYLPWTFLVIWTVPLLLASLTGRTAVSSAGVFGVSYFSAWSVWWQDLAGARITVDNGFWFTLADGTKLRSGSVVPGALNPTGIYRSDEENAKAFMAIVREKGLEVEFSWPVVPLGREARRPQL